MVLAPAGRRILCTCASPTAYGSHNDEALWKQTKKKKKKLFAGVLTYHQ